MGTSSLYRGPKSSSLLPQDYPGLDDGNGITPSDSATSPELQAPANGNADAEALPIPASWSKPKSSLSKSVNGGHRYLSNALRSYTKALGGHENAARTAVSAKHTAAIMFSMFLGSSTDIQNRLMNSGIPLQNRPTTDIFNDICNSISPNADTKENAIVRESFCETIADIVAGDNFDPNSLDVFNERLLEQMLGGFIKHYIYNRLMNDISAGLLKYDVEDISQTENEIWTIIDGIVSGVISSHLEGAIHNDDVKNLVDDLFDTCYSLIENQE